MLETIMDTYTRELMGQINMFPDTDRAASILPRLVLAKMRIVLPHAAIIGVDEIVMARMSREDPRRVPIAEQQRKSMEKIRKEVSEFVSTLMEVGQVCDRIR